MLRNLQTCFSIDDLADVREMIEVQESWKAAEADNDKAAAAAERAKHGR